MTGGPCELLPIFSVIQYKYTNSSTDGPLGHGSFLTISEVLMKNFLQCIRKMQKERIKSLTPKQSMADALAEHAHLYLQRTAWTGSCNSWFKQGKVDGPAMVS